MSAHLSPFDAAIDALMGRVYRRAGRDLEAEIEAPEPLDALLQPEPCAPGADSEEERDRMREELAIGGRYLRRFFAYVMARGPHPRHVMPRFYSAVNAVDPALLLHMTGEELAALWGQGRAAESARARHLDHLLEKVTRPGASFAGGKSATTREKLKRAAKGNQNRKRGRRRRAAQPTPFPDPISPSTKTANPQVA